MNRRSTNRQPSPELVTAWRAYQEAKAAYWNRRLHEPLQRVRLLSPELADRLQRAWEQPQTD